LLEEISAFSPRRVLCEMVQVRPTGKAGGASLGALTRPGAVLCVSAHLSLRRQFYQACKTGIMDRALSIYFLLGWLGGDLLNLIGSFLADQLPLQVPTDSLGLARLSNAPDSREEGWDGHCFVWYWEPETPTVLGCSLLPRDAVLCPGMLAHPRHQLEAFLRVGPSRPSPRRFTRPFTTCSQTW